MMCFCQSRWSDLNRRSRASDARGHSRLAHISREYPRQDSNPVYDVRSVACFRHTPRIRICPDQDLNLECRLRKAE